MRVAGEQLQAMLGFFVTTFSTALKSPPNTWFVALQKYLHSRIEKPLSISFLKVTAGI